MKDCPTCAYRTTCNQRYRGQDCKYWKGEEMSDMQPTEADREEARKIFDDTCTCDVCNHKVERIAYAIARIRADAVKAERERIRTDLMEKIDSMKMVSTAIPGPEYEFRMTRWAMDEVLSFLLSDDQEDRHEQR